MGEVHSIATGDGAAESYLTGTPGTPGVLLYMDAIGLRPRIADMADEIGSWGYRVLAPNVFYRAGAVAELAPRSDLRNPAERDAYFAGGAFERYVEHGKDRTLIDAPVWLSALAECAATFPVGVVGYCMGVRMALWTAGAHPDVVAAVGGFHGGALVTTTGDSPHRSVLTSKAEYVFGHADQDPDMTIADVAALELVLRETGRAHRNEIYLGAPHGYSMADTSAYHEAASARHFSVLKGLFDHALGQAI